MKILITGSQGQLGNTLSNLLKVKNNSLGHIPEEYNNCEVIGVDVNELDITNRKKVEEFINRTQPDLIINCAAMTNVDGCETERNLAEAVNAEGPENLAIAANNVGAKIVHVSTDYVFQGDAATPYIETDTCNPVTAYGESKRNGEIKVANATDRHFIFRTSWLYGLVGNNFVKTIRRVAKEKGALTVVNDQRGNPTNCEDLAFHILLVAITDNYGIYHCTGNGECTWFDFAKKIVEFSNIPCTVDPCTTEQSNRPAKRPAFSSLDNKHLRETVGDNMRDWTLALKEYISKLEQSENI